MVLFKNDDSFNRLINKFDRLIYAVMFLWFVGVSVYIYISIEYFSDKNSGELHASTKIAFWFLSFVVVISTLKIIFDLLNPKYRKQYFKKLK